MGPRTFTLLLCVALSALGKQKVAEGQAANASAGIRATVYADPESIQQLLGDNLQGHYIIVQVQLTPKAKLNIDLDDFLLRTDKDGERSHPFKPTQIAGDGAMIVTEQTVAGGGIHHNTGFGGILMGGGGGVGNAATTSESKATMQEATGQKNPLLDVLAAKILPEKEADLQPVSGLLYFPMEKQKVKDLELFYATPTGKLSLRFR